MRLALTLLGLPLLATPPTFSVRDAIRAEWKRQPLAASESAQLSATDRARQDLTLQRIGAPGAPALLPPELDKPTLEIWEARAALAKTPQERFTALFFLNRLKSAKALFTLEGLGAKDADDWPKHLHLETQIATARLNGCEVGPELRGFLEALKKAGKIDPVRAQAAQLRLVMGGKEKELLHTLRATPARVLALMDAFNRGSSADKKRAIQSFPEKWTLEDFLPLIGLEKTPEKDNALTGPLVQRFAEGNPVGYSGGFPAVDALRLGAASSNPSIASTVRGALGEFEMCEAGELAAAILSNFPHQELGALLPSLRKLNPIQADKLRTELLSGSDPIARAAAIDDMTEAPADLDALITRLWKVEEYDGVQVLLPSLEKWKLPEARRIAILQRFYEHPCWTARLDAWREHSKLDSKAPWPAPPTASATDAGILKEAARLATAGKPVRLRLHFAGKRSVTLRLDPVNAPMNVANLVILARKGFFNGRLVPRVVPDFVVQMGSPCDTMDGGPGYTVRCENSLDWYGPGSVGMALSGKDTGGSQFFITTNAAPHLTGKYTRVGEVEDLDHALKILDDLELGAKLERVEVLVPTMQR